MQAGAHPSVRAALPSARRFRPGLAQTPRFRDPEAGDFAFEPARNPERKHAQIARQRPEGMAKCGGPVALDKSMTDPGETVTAHERAEEPARIGLDHGQGKAEEGQGGP